MTKLQIATTKAIKDWSKSQSIKVISVRHIYPRAYVIARPALSCIIVACPLVDREPHLKGFTDNSDGTNILHEFDKGLRIGDWCSVAYVSRLGIQSSIAIKCVE